MPIKPIVAPKDSTAKVMVGLFCLSALMSIMASPMLLSKPNPVQDVDSTTQPIRPDHLLGVE